MLSDWERRTVSTRRIIRSRSERQPTRGLRILVAPVTAPKYNTISQLGHNFVGRFTGANSNATMSGKTNRAQIRGKDPGAGANLQSMAGLRGKSRPPRNQNAFRHSLAAVHNRRAEGELTENERDIRAEILAGLISDSGGEAQIRTATKILAEMISSNVALLVTFNQAIDGVIKNNQKARQNPKVSSIGQLQTASGRLVVGESPAVRL